MTGSFFHGLFMFIVLDQQKTHLFGNKQNHQLIVGIQVGGLCPSSQDPAGFL